MKVLNIGSMNLDYVYDVDHIVRPGETTSSNAMNVFCGGKGLNQSIALAKAGVKVYHAGIVGEDADILLQACKDNGIDDRYVKKVEGKSGHTIIQVDKNGQNSIILYGGGNQMFTREYIDEVLTDFAEGDYIILQNEINELDYIIDAAYKKKMIIILNPSPFDEKIYKCNLDKVAIFMINEIEGREMANYDAREDEFVEINDDIIRKLTSMYRNAAFVMTLGEEGAVCATQDEIIWQEAFETKAVDTTAAGDTFTGYFLYGIINGMGVEDSLTLASKAASITVSRKGASASIPEIEELIEE